MSWTIKAVKEGRNMEIENEAETIDEFCLHTCFIWLPYLLIQPRSAYPGMTLPVVGWEPLHESANKKISPQTSPQAILTETILQMKVLLPSLSGWQPISYNEPEKPFAK